MTFAKALPRGDTHKSKLEAEYAERLYALVRAGEIKQYLYEPVRLKLGKGCWYKPDFMVITNELHIEFHETKGSWKARGQRDGRTRIKVAAERYKLFKFVAVTRDKRGGWRWEDF